MSEVIELLSCQREKVLRIQLKKPIHHSCTHPGCEHSDFVHRSKPTVFMGPVQDLTEMSTDISKDVISTVGQPL